jgi:hypothetical protein
MSRIEEELNGDGPMAAPDRLNREVRTCRDGSCSLKGAWERMRLRPDEEAALRRGALVEMFEPLPPVELSVGMPVPVELSCRVVQA